MRIVEHKLYEFGELDSEAQEKALQELRHINVDFEDWHESVLEMAYEILDAIGVEDAQIYYRGFCSQGDGACFTGQYSYKNYEDSDLLNSLMEIHSELRRIIHQIDGAQHDANWALEARIKHVGFYNHENSVVIVVDADEDTLGCEPEEVDEGSDVSVIDTLEEAFQDLMRWIYRQLEKEFWYQTEDEQVKEAIEANEIEFYEDGTPA